MVVRRDLKMGKGKIAAQCCHGSIGSYKRTDSKLIKKWESDGYVKVVCKVDSLEELLDLKKEADKNNVSNYLVVDAGRTQLPTSTTTVLGIGPDEDEIMDKITGDLKLLWVSFNLMIASFN